MDGVPVHLRRAHTAATPASSAPPVLLRSRSAPRRGDGRLALCLEVPWGQRPEALPCQHGWQGTVEVECLETSQLSHEEILRLQFLCHRSKFAARLLGFSRRPSNTAVEDAIGTRLFYAKPWQPASTLQPAALAQFSPLQRLHVAHSAATALWTLHSLGATFGRWDKGLGLAADGKVEFMGVGLDCGSVAEDLQALGALLKRLASQDDVPPEGNLLEDLASELLHAEVGTHEATLQGTVTCLARFIRSAEGGPQPPRGPKAPLRRFALRWRKLRHVLRACWALQRGLEAFCCVCLEAAPKSLGLLCPRPHGRHQLLCGDCLEPYVCSLIGTAELKRHEGGVVCPACACADGEPTIFSRAEVQSRLLGSALRRYVEATDPEPPPESGQEEQADLEWAVLVEDLTTRSVRLVTHTRVSENDEPKEVRKSKDVMPFTWLLLGDEFIQYDPQQMRLRQHMSPRLFQLQVAECLTLHCPKCHCPLDPDPDGCVAMSCLACNEGFCWVCFTCCGDDAHQHAMEVHGSYFPGEEFVKAWHRMLRWKRVRHIWTQLLEESQQDALAASKALLQAVELWPFPTVPPDVPDWAEQMLNVDGEPWGRVHLHLAARLGRMEDLRQALEEEDVNLQDRRGMTALCYACHEGRIQAIRLLMDSAADPNLADFHGVTPLHYACREPPFAIEEDVAGLLLSYPQVEANQRDDTGASAILVAAEVGRHRVIPSLLGCERLDPNLTNHLGRTALLVATSFDHSEVVMQLLRSSRVHVHLRGQHGETPLHLAALRGSLEVVQLLLAHPDTELNAVNHLGRSALHEAAGLGADEVVRCLLGAEQVVVDRKDHKGSTPLMLAAMAGSLETFEQLLPLSRSLHDKDQEGCTVLMRLAARGAVRGHAAHACLQLLRLQPNVDIDVQSADGSTALMLAVRNGCLPSVEDLLAWGASLAPHDARGETAWSLASLCRPAAMFRAMRHLLPREDVAISTALLFDGLLLLPVERANRTLLAGGGYDFYDHSTLTVEFESQTLRKWKLAGYKLFLRDAFYEEHEDCMHELEIQRVNGVAFVNQEFSDGDGIKLRNCRHVRQLTDWHKEGWFFSDDGRKLCHVGARKKAAPLVLEEVTDDSFNAINEFLDSFY